MLKNFLILFYILILNVLTSSGCTQTQETLTIIEPIEVSNQIKGKVGLSTMYQSPYFLKITEGLKSTMIPAGYEVIELFGNYNVEQQIDDIEDFIEQDVKAIFVSPYDSEAIKPALESAQKAGIPVLCIDAPCYDEELVVANVATDNYEAGVAVAEDMINKLDTKGLVALIQSSKTLSNENRVEGFIDTINKYAPDITVITQEKYFSQKDTARENMKNLLQTVNIDGVFATSGMGGLGAIEALEIFNQLDKTIVYSVDGLREEIDMIKAGKLTGSSAQQPYEIGKIGGQVMLDHLEGKKVNKSIKIPIIFVDISNVDSYEPYD